MTPKADRLDTFGREPAFEGAEIRTVRHVATLAQRMTDGAMQVATFGLRFLDVAVLVAMAADLFGLRLAELTGAGHLLMRPFWFVSATRLGVGQLDWAGALAIAALVGLEVGVRWAVGAVRTK